MKLKQKRYNEFIADWLPDISYFCNVSKHTSDGFKISSDEHQTVIYYPKSDRIQFPSNNKWMDNGLVYIKKNILHR